MSVTVVYIEDDQENYELVCRLLEAAGDYEVLQAIDGQAGLDLVHQRRPDLVLVDLDIPVVNGFEVARQLKHSDDPAIAAIPIAAVSAHILKREQDRALEAGCACFIEKPFDIRAFRDQVKSLTT